MTNISCEMTEEALVKFQVGKGRSDSTVSRVLAFQVADFFLSGTSKRALCKVISGCAQKEKKSSRHSYVSMCYY